MPAVFLYMATRALGFAVGAGLVITAFLVLSVHLSGSDPDRNFSEAVMAAAIASALMVGFLLVLNVVSGFLHLRALRAAGIEVNRSTVAVGHSAEISVVVDPQSAFRHARGALKAIGARVIKEERAAGRIRATRPDPTKRGFAQAVTVDVAGHGDGATVRVASHATLRLSVFDMGRGRITVEEFAAELRGRAEDTVVA
ncbi:hypothetical protein ACWGI8_29470 [Streptomyces sp. NPDC054841]